MEIRSIFNAILDKASTENYSDIHFSTWSTPMIRDISGEIVELKSVMLDGMDTQTIAFTRPDIEAIIEIVTSKQGVEKFKTDLELDTGYRYSETSRYRVNCYVDSNGYSIAFRGIPQNIPTLDELGLWESVKDMCKASKGFILMTGPTGSWKSTNLAAMVEYINTNLKRHIITIEDPIEFIFKKKQSLINQREIGIHTKSFETAMRAALREDPDVIMIWEMRDPETIKAAITLAETGHLVLSSLHTNDTVQTVDRIVDVFPAGQQDQIKMQFAMSLLWVVSQRLLPRTDKEWRIAAREVLLSTDAVKNLIISGKNHQLYSVLEVGQKDGMISMDKYLLALYKKEIISKDVLMSYVRDKEWLQVLLDN